MSLPSIDDILQSSLTLLLYLALAGGALWFFFHRRLPRTFFVGYGIGALYLLYVNAQNNRADKVFQGSVTDAAIASAPSIGVYGAGAQTVGDLVGSL